MTSKNSLSKLILNDSKRRLWLFLLLAVGFMLMIPLATAIIFGQIQNLLARGEIANWQVAYEFRYLIGQNSYLVPMGVVISAVLSAFSGFGYLYKKTKLDLFHSIPIKREKLFFIQYLSGVIIFAIPFVVSYLLMLLICAINSYLPTEILVMIMQNMGYGLLHFLTYYSVAILAIMLTGRVIVGGLGMIVFWGYMPLLYFIIRGLHERFFETYYVGDFGERLIDWLVYMSPVTLQFIQITSGVSRFLDSKMWQPGIMMAIEVTIILATLFLSVWLYRKRPSEATEHAMAFPKTMPIVKVLIMIVLSIGAGMFFDLLAGGLWFILGMIIGLILSQGLIAVIYTGDIRKILTGKKSLGIATLVVIAIVATFRFDPFGYDTYLPNPDSVESVGISIEVLNSEVDYPELFEGNNYFDYFVNASTHRFEKSQIEDIPAFYDIVRAGIETTKKYENDQRHILGEDDSVYWEDHVTVCFKMNSGRKVYRRYYVDMEKIEPELAKVYDEKSFKEVEYPILSTKPDDMVSVRVENPFNLEDDKEIAPADKQRFIEAYKEDLLGLKLTDIKWANVVGVIHCEVEARLEPNPTSQLDRVYYGGGWEYLFSEGENLFMTYPIYPACKKTLSVLEELGYDFKGKVEADEVYKIIIVRSKDVYEEDLVSIEITDEHEIEKLLASSLYSMYSSFYPRNANDERVEIYFDNQGDSDYQNLLMREEDVPPFIEEKFKNDATEYTF